MFMLHKNQCECVLCTVACPETDMDVHFWVYVALNVKNNVSILLAVSFLPSCSSLALTLSFPAHFRIPNITQEATDVQRMIMDAPAIL